MASAPKQPPMTRAPNTHLEALARERLCPMVRENIGGVTAGFPIHPNCLCIASRCMAWRWADHETGYCGLAGSPLPHARS